MLVIGIAGPKYSGKDTVANWIVDCGGLLRKASFATPIKKMLSVGLGLTHEQLYGDQKEIVDPRYGRTPRDIMQTLGTEWGRRMVCDDVWLKALFVVLQREGSGGAVVADVRFNNEADLIREKGGWIIHIEGRDLKTEGSDHASEAGVKWRLGDMMLDNSGTKADLVYTCQPIIERIYEETE